MSSGSNPKKILLEHVAGLAKALANASRLDILELVAQGDRGVESIAQAAGLSIANASQHLQVLRRAGLVTSRKAGKQVLYRLSDDDVLSLLEALRASAERHVAEVDRVMDSYFRAKDSMEPISHDDLVGRLRDGLVTVLDVRPREEYEAGHVAGAIGIPLAELKRRLKELPPDTEVVAYCRGAYCVLSYEAVSLLRSHGFRARRLADGYPEWRAAGRPAEIAESR